MSTDHFGGSNSEQKHSQPAVAALAQALRGWSPHPMSQNCLVVHGEYVVLVG